MATPSAISSLVNDLVVSLVPRHVPQTKFRRLKDSFNRKLKLHNYARTNQFEIAERLDGLQEKVLLNNYDELADALHRRRSELKLASSYHSDKWIPDVLHLLLQLSDDPVNKVRIEDLVKGEASAPVTRTLRWADIEDGDPIDRNDEIWMSPEYSDLSSDEDESHHLSEATSPSVRVDGDAPQQQTLDTDGYFKPREEVPSPVDVQNVSARLTNLDASGRTVISELEAVRETLFMLQGLPTSLFWRVGDDFEVDKRIGLGHLSDDAFRDILRSLSNIRRRVDVVSSWAKRPQSTPFMQTLRSEVGSCLSDFHGKIVAMESRLLRVPRGSVIVSLAKVSQDILSESNVILQVASLIDGMVKGGVDDIGSLDMLCDTICECQMEGRDEALSRLSGVFLTCLETYLRPVQRWLDFGVIEPTDPPFFVRRQHAGHTPASRLWHDMFVLDLGSGASRAPRFLHSLAHPIFVAGKTKYFLRQLATGQRSESAAGSVSGSGPSSGLIQAARATEPDLFPFSLGANLTATVEDGLGAAAGTLQERLVHDQGLWRTLVALDYVFFGKSGPHTDVVDAWIFDRIDRGSAAWNDRFLVTDLCHEVFGGLAVVDAARIQVHSRPSSSRDLQSRRTSVKLLGDLAFDYALPWALENVFSARALTVYRRIGVFLMQIRRARHLLGRRCRAAVLAGHLSCGEAANKAARALHAGLLLFATSLYDHLTAVVLDDAAASMRATLLAAAADVDHMAAAHHAYVGQIEDLCLVARRLGPIHRAVVAVLDLAVRFSDLVATTTNDNHPSSPGARSSDAEAMSYVSAASRPGRRRRRHRTSDSSSDDDDDDDSDDDDDDDDDGEGYSTFVTLQDLDRPYAAELAELAAQFARHRAFVVAGLRGLGRVREERTQACELLADRLDWK